MNARLDRILREELLRSVAWIGLGLVGWATVVDGLAWLDASVSTVFGLPVLTWAVLTAGTIGVRYASGADLQMQTQRYSWTSVATGLALNSLAAAYLVVIEGLGVLPVGVACVAITAVTVGWYWYIGWFAPTKLSVQ
jgi:hypothetical protein